MLKPGDLFYSDHSKKLLGIVLKILWANELAEIIYYSFKYHKKIVDWRWAEDINGDKEKEK